MIARRRRAPEPCDAVRFIEGTLNNPETGAPFVLTDAEKVFLAHAFDQHQDGRAVYPELVFGAPKKSARRAGRPVHALRRAGAGRKRPKGMSPPTLASRRPTASSWPPRASSRRAHCCAPTPR